MANSFAQEVKLGFRTELFGASYQKTDIGKKFYLNSLPPGNFYFVLAYNFAHNFQLDFRPGYSIIENYGGFEFGGYLKYFPSESIYLIAAYNAHFNVGEAHGFHTNNATTFSMPGLGVGLVTGEYSSLEFIAFIPSPKEWMHDYEFENGELKKITYSFDVIVKIGFGFDWPI